MFYMSDSLQLADNLIDRVSLKAVCVSDVSLVEYEKLDVVFVKESQIVIFTLVRSAQDSLFAGEEEFLHVLSPVQQSNCLVDTDSVEFDSL